MKILIPTALQAYAESNDTVEVQAATVGEAMERLAERYRDLRQHLYGEEGKLRSYVNIYVNDEDYRYLKRERTPVSDADTLSIVPSIAGGTR